MSTARLVVELGALTLGVAFLSVLPFAILALAAKAARGGIRKVTRW